MSPGGTKGGQPERSAGAGGCIACVVDDDPRFHLEALRWYASLTEVAGVDPSDLVVQAVGPLASEPLRYLERQGVTVRSIDRFDERSPHCNKIAGALRLAEDAHDGVVVLSDADTAILDDPRRIERPDRALSAKTVDWPLPPIETLNRIFETAGIPLPPHVPLPWGPDDQRTIAGNCNGGIYLVDGALLPQLSSAWATWALWLLDRSELLGEWAVYVDQVAMALALAAEKIEWHSLDVGWNTPTHDQTRIPPDPPRPHVLHYHQEVEPSGLIRSVGRPSIDGQIEIANAAIAKVFEDVAPRATLRRWRSAAPPHVTVAADPRVVLASLAASLGRPSVLEVAEPEHSATGGLSASERQLAVPSIEAVAAARSRLRGADSERSREHRADLTVGLDVLQHVASAAEYRRMIELLWDTAGEALVVSGFSDCFGERSPGEYYHEPLRQTLSEVAPDAEVYPVAADGSSETVVVLRAPDHPHPRDFGSSTLEPLIDRVPDPAALLTMRLSARTSTGFYPDHSPRLWEYPVVARLVSEHLDPGSRLVDIGAGVSPLSPYLSSRGYLVETVDPSPIRRDWSDHLEWNEWHFLDYEAAGLASRSWNCTLDRIPSRPFFDGAYSVSVIEHVPAEQRRTLLADISARTRIGGLVVLTIDLQPGTDDLWNYNLGIQVDEPTQHGTLQSVVEECSSVGLELLHEERVRDWPVTHVEIGLLALRQTAPVPVGRGRLAREGLRRWATQRATPRRS